MNERLDLADLARLHDQARQRAAELRRKAITEWMNDLGRALDRATDHAARAARRWAHRLARHQRRRQADAATSRCA